MICIYYNIARLTPNNQLQIRYEIMTAVEFVTAKYLHKSKD